MPYSKTTWKDRLVEFANRFTKSNETATSVTLTADPGVVTEAGTPLSAANLNKIEQGIADAAATADAAVPKAANMQISDANALTTEGQFNVGSTWTGSPFAGSNGANQGYLQHFGWYFSGNNTAYCLQIHTEVNGNKRRRYRLKENGTWGSWVEIITSAGGTMTGNTVHENTFGQKGKKATGGTEIFVSRVSGDNVFIGDSSAETRINGTNIRYYDGASLQQIWHSGNDGAGSGLDADTVRGFGGISNAAGDGSLRVTNQYGYIDVGPKNTSFCHLYTDIAGGFYFNKTDIYANGNMVWHDGRLRWNSGRLEYNDGGTWKAVGGVKSVQRGIVNLPATSGTITNVTISAVDITKAFVNISSFSDTNGGRFFVKLTSSTNLEFQSWIGSGLSGLPWEVVEHY